MVQALEKLSPKRRQNRLDRRERVLSTAMDLLRSDGLEGFSLHKVADRLNYAVAALYRYFPSRTALLAELESQAIEVFRGELNQAQSFGQAWTGPVSDQGRALLRVLAMAEAFEAMAHRSPGHFLLVNQLVSDPKDVMPEEQFSALLPKATALFVEITSVLENAARAEALLPGNALERAVLFWSALHGLFQVRKIISRRMALFPEAALRQSLMQTLLLGWGASPEVLAEVLGILASDPWRSGFNALPSVTSLVSEQKTHPIKEATP